MWFPPSQSHRNYGCASLEDDTEVSLRKWNLEDKQFLSALCNSLQLMTDDELHWLEFVIVRVLEALNESPCAGGKQQLQPVMQSAAVYSFCDHVMKKKTLTMYSSTKNEDLFISPADLGDLFGGLCVQGDTETTAVALRKWIQCLLMSFRRMKISEPISFFRGMCFYLLRQIRCQINSLEHAFSPVNELPSTERKLKSKLQELDLSEKRRHENVDLAVAELRQLQTLKLVQCGLTTLPDSLGELKVTGLKSASLKATGTMPELSIKNVVEIPEEAVLQFVETCSLDLSDNPGIRLDNLPRFKNVRQLNLGNCLLSVIPKEISELRQLEELDLSENRLDESVNLAIPQLRQLKTLRLAKCGLTTLPDSIGELKVLAELDVSWNVFSRGLHHGIESMRRLKKLSVCRCGLTSLPDWLGNLKSLEELDISDNEFSNGLHPSIGHLELLKKLTAHHCEITALPDSIGDLARLEELDISGNELSDGLKDAVGQLRLLKKLVVHHSELTNISDSLGALEMLEEVDLAGNNFSGGLNPIIGQLSNMRILALQDCEIANLPDSIGDLRSLEVLDLSGNSFLDGLNKTIGGLHRLRTLRLVRCELSTIPKLLERLTQLKELELSHNSFSTDVELSIQPTFRLIKLALIGCELTTVPEWICEQEELEELDLSRNNFSAGLKTATRPMFKLKKLSLSGCELTRIPNWLCKQCQLEELDLSLNNFSNGLQLSIRPQFQLTRLSLAGCDLTTPPDWISDQRKLHHFKLQSSNYSDAMTHSSTQEERDLNYKAITNLYGQLSEIMRTINCEIGFSSYFFQMKLGELVVHPRDTRDTEILKTRLPDLIKKYRLEDAVTLKIAEEPVFSKFCYVVEGKNCAQNIGMYVQENDQVFWVSTAHGLVKQYSPDWIAASTEFEQLQAGQKMDPLSLTISLGIEKRPLSTPCVYFSQPKERFMIDIMLGPMMPSSRILIGAPEFHFQNFDGAQTPLLFTEWQGASIMNLSRQGKIMNDLMGLMGHKLISYSWRNETVLQGSISSLGETPFELIGQRKKSKAIFIKSANDVIPREGDSGSVWVTLKEGKGFEAVAITNGVVQKPGDEAWVVTPLIYSLTSLRSKYPEHFPSIQGFTGFGLFLPRNARDL